MKKELLISLLLCLIICVASASAEGLILKGAEGNSLEKGATLSGHYYYQSTVKAYKKWQDQTLAYYSASAVECVEPEAISEEERIERRNAYMSEHHDGGEE